MSKKIDQLLELYQQGETVDQELFAEMRSNILLIAGDHYTKKGSKYFNTVRESKDLTKEQKIRLTQNHIYRIAKTYVNAITSTAPTAVAAPTNEKEQQDVKAAELHNSVIQYAKTKMRFDEKTIQFAEDFVGIGEVAVKLFWDPMAGDFRGKSQEIDPETGEIVEGEAQFTGDMVSERIFGFNLLRLPKTKEIGVGDPVCIRKMVNTADLKLKVPHDKVSLVTETQDKAFKVFEASSGSYGDSKGQTLWLEFYFPKCAEYPNGYYYHCTEAGIIFEGELPFGIWPIIYTGFDAVQTSPRHRSIIKQLRPIQMELNRAKSKVVEHQISIGDDKLLISGGAKVSNGIQLPGIRTVHISGGKAEYMSGRAGDQYLPYIAGTVDEMDRVAMLDGIEAEKEGQGDPLVNLYRRIRQKKKFSVYTDKFESFLIRYWETYLALAKAYFPEDMIIPMIGKNEAVNITEFKNTEKLCYQIKVEPQSDDLETQMGRQMIFNHILQYVGPNLDKKVVGQLIKQMPFGNWKGGFSEMTLDEDMATNMILGLDRGKVPMPNKYDDDTYMIRRLVARTRQSDFTMLHPQIQKNYERMIKHYEDQEAEKQMKIAAAQKGFIPSGGARVKAQVYVPSPGNPAKVELATFPTESLIWLMKQLAAQGSSQEQLQMMNQGAVAEIAASLNQKEAAMLQGSGGQPQGELQ